jgi:ketosteroid isomerase-like protein
LEEKMKARIVCGLALILGIAIVVSRAQGSRESDVVKTISDGERKWAEAVVTADTAFLDGILADDYWGLGVDGTFHGKAVELEETKKSKGLFISNHVTDVKVRVFGDTAIAQGSETWEVIKGEPKRGRYVWTDTWLKRGGKWQVVASADVQAPEEKK